MTEDSVEDYTAEITGDAVNGFVITNTVDVRVPLRIVKVDRDTEEGLSGARFQLTRKTADEESFTVFENDLFEEGEDGRHNGPFTVDSENGVVIHGLIPGTYKITEIQAPTGYVITLQPFEFTIEADGTIAPSVFEHELVEYIPAGDTDPAGYQISNQPGAELPSAGGNGILLFRMLGAVIVVLAALMLGIQKKRRGGDLRT